MAVQHRPVRRVRARAQRVMTAQERMRAAGSMIAPAQAMGYRATREEMEFSMMFCSCVCVLVEVMGVLCEGCEESGDNGEGLHDVDVWSGLLEVWCGCVV